MIPASAFIQARHITITAELVQSVGGMNEAAIASLIQWKTEPDAPYATEDGWWEATAEFLSDWTGLSIPQVRRALKKLIDDGHIEAAELRRRGVSDRTLSYRIVRDVEVTKSSPLEVTKSSPHQVTESSALPLTDTYETPMRDPFDVFWEKWPKKTKKPDAQTAWRAAMKRATPAVIIAGLELHLPAMLATDVQFRPGAGPWLRNNCWADEVIPPSPTSRGGTKPQRPPIDPQREWEYR